jgi:hypothetical protein
MRRRCNLAAGALLALAAPGWLTQTGMPAAGAAASSGLKESEAMPARRFDAGRGPRVVVQNRVGSVTVVAGDDGAIVVEAVKRGATKEDLAAIKPEVTHDKGTVTVRWMPAEPTVTNRSLDVTVKAPRATTLELETEVGAIRIEGLGHGARARTGVGAITAERVTGALNLASGNGAIDVRGAAGDVTAETGVGAITLKGTAGARKVESGNGAVVIDGAEGPVSVRTQLGRIDVKHARGDLDLHTDNGAVAVAGANGKVVAETMLGAVDVAGRLSGACRLHSGNGTVTVTLPADSRLKIKASTGTGAITNAFGLPVEGFGPRTCSGKIGDGSGGSLRVETMVGAISLNKP